MAGRRSSASHCGVWCGALEEAAKDLAVALALAVDADGAASIRGTQRQLWLGWLLARLCGTGALLDAVDGPLPVPIDARRLVADDVARGR